MSHSNSVPESSFTPSTTTSPPLPLKNEPITFIADTDSRKWILDTGTNRFIVNDLNLLSDYTPGGGKVKGINGNPTIISGTGILKLCIKSDSGRHVSLPPISAVYIPSCPYNLLSPQLLISHLKEHGYSVPPFQHTDTAYTFEFTCPPSQQLPSSLRFTCPLTSKSLFQFYSHDGYDHFQHRLHRLSPSWTALTGPVHIIPDDNEAATDPILCQPVFQPPSTTRENSSISPSSFHEIKEQLHDKTRESRLDKTRELRLDKTRESLPHKTRESTPSQIPATDNDIPPIKLEPTSIDFKTQQANLLADARIEATKLKQHLLLIIHET